MYHMKALPAPKKPYRFPWIQALAWWLGFSFLGWLVSKFVFPVLVCNTFTCYASLRFTHGPDGMPKYYSTYGGTMKNIADPFHPPDFKNYFELRAR